MRGPWYDPLAIMDVYVAQVHRMGKSYLDSDKRPSDIANEIADAIASKVRPRPKGPKEQAALRYAVLRLMAMEGEMLGADIEPDERDPT